MSSVAALGLETAQRGRVKLGGGKGASLSVPVRKKKKGQRWLTTQSVKRGHRGCRRDGFEERKKVKRGRRPGGSVGRTPQGKGRQIPAAEGSKVERSDTWDEKDQA